MESITATSPTVLTITLKSPDYMLAGELSSIPGMVVQQKYAEAKGPEFGTPDAGVMCSGAYENTGWTVGQGMTVTRNDSYWDTSVKPKTKSIKLIAAADPTAITAGLLSGDITGTYMTGATGTLQQLESSGKVTVTQGASYVVDALITSTGNGVLTDPVVRKALSMAIDRPAYISAVWEGAASMPKALNPPATWGYGKDVFAAGYAALPGDDP